MFENHHLQRIFENHIGHFRVHAWKPGRLGEFNQIHPNYIWVPYRQKNYTFKTP